MCARLLEGPTKAIGKIKEIMVNARFGAAHGVLTQSRQQFYLLTLSSDCLVRVVRVYLSDAITWTANADA